ncbi:hypothetical protein M501DRAFT_1014631 [Patellaria atrata CBS 101060]|uniref:Uncharacterized protein n=1 Tax=Patellaria atrata CBS 101060 TaxID=1346257 RepID=A0A9P4SF37_9PEZI|nr:hypothetical protein M501DRAFT_1014631 [Patellaria atrata CBS 101060]
MEEMFNLYFFADEYDVPKLLNDTISVLYEHTALPTRMDIISAYEKLRSSSLLRKFFGGDSWIEDPPDLPAQFILDVMMGFARQIVDCKEKDSQLDPKCSYHEHANVEEKKNCPDYKKTSPDFRK